MSDTKIKVWVSDCLKKTRYETQRDARKVKRKVFKDRKERTRVYLCPHCDGYHLTKNL